MRALLVVNTFATTTTPEVQSVISAALEKHLDLTVVNTSAKFDAATIARDAKYQGYELIIGLGGDGTLNEIANGLLVDGSNVDGPILAGIPGGNANVFLRNLGYSDDPETATAQLMQLIAAGSTKTLGVGKLSFENTSRWFLFNSGIGIDAKVLAKMEAQRATGKQASDVAYALLAVKELVREIRKRKTSIVVTDENGQRFDPVQLALVINFAPWTYAGKTAVTPIMQSKATAAFDFFATRQLSALNTLRLLKGLIGKSDIETDSKNLVLRNQKSISISVDKPTWIQVDGEPIAKISTAHFDHFADCLKVLA